MIWPQKRQLRPRGKTPGGNRGHNWQWLLTVSVNDGRQRHLKEVLQGAGWGNTVISRCISSWDPYRNWLMDLHNVHIYILSEISSSKLQMANNETGLLSFSPLVRPSEFHASRMSCDFMAELAIYGARQMGDERRAYGGLPGDRKNRASLSPRLSPSTQLFFTAPPPRC